MAKIEYKTAPPNVLKVAPNGRVPYINLDGRIIGDSSLIIKKLKERFGDPLDGHLSSEQRSQALLLQCLVENHLYFATLWLRWSDKESWKFVHDYFKPFLPALLSEIILKMIRKDVIKTSQAHGMGEHTREDIIDFAKTDLTALSDLLGENSFFLGEQPTAIDATMYGFLVQVLWVPWNNPAKQHGLSLKNLDNYCHRMQQMFWS